MPDQALEDLKQSVATLTSTVEDLRENSADPLTREAVERLVEETLVRQRAAAPAANKDRPGFVPGDEDGDEPAGLPKERAKRLEHILTRSAKKVAPLVRQSEADVRAFQERSDQLVLLSAALECNPRETQFYTEEFLPATRAMDTQTAAEGLEFVPRSLSANLIERVALELKVAALFGIIPMPTNPFDIPGRPVSRQRLAKGVENTADTGQTAVKKITPASRKITLTAKKFWGEALISKEADEDSIIAILPFAQEELIDYLQADLEDATINGDTTGTHMDNDVSASDDPRRNFDGLRKSLLAAAKTDAAAAALTVAMLRTNRAKMGKYGVNPTRLAHVISINNYIQILGDTNVQTMDKYGQNATILSGELGKADGAPLIVSEYSRTDVAATGVNTVGGPNTTAVALTAYTPGFIRGEKRGTEIELLKELYSEYDQNAVKVSLRQAFSARFPVATEKIVAEHINVLA